MLSLLDRASWSDEPREALTEDEEEGHSGQNFKLKDIIEAMFSFVSFYLLPRILKKKKKKNWCYVEKQLMNGDLWIKAIEERSGGLSSFLNFTIEDIAHSSNAMRQQCFLFFFSSHFIFCP